MRLAIQDALCYWMALQLLFSLWLCNLKEHLIPGDTAGVQLHLACDNHGPKKKDAVLKMSEIHFFLGENEGETGGN